MEQNVNLDNQVTDIKMEIKSEPDDIPVPYEDVVPKLANEETILFDQNGSGFEIKKEWETEYEVEKIVMEQVICFDNKDDVKCKIESITKELGLKSEERVVTSNEDPINTSCKNCVFKTEKKDSVAGPLSHEDEQVCSPSCVCAKCSITDMRLPCQCKESLSVDRSFLRSEKQPHERRQASTSEEEPDALTRPLLQEGGQAILMEGRNTSIAIRTRWILKPNLCNREVSHTCGVCGRSFSRNSALKVHQYVHSADRPYKCAECEKSFCKKSGLEIHQRVHSGERPYTCAVCEKCFSDVSSLYKHHRVHTGERPYKCEVCGKCFSETSSLYKHHRVHTGERPYKCAVCGKSFSHSSARRTHQSVHTGYRPYNCAECGSSFSRKSHLLQHQYVHTGHRPYKCAECGAGFSRNSRLQEHQLLHTRGGPYKCAKCGETFFQKSYLLNHEHVHAGEQLKMCTAGEQL